MDEIAALQQQLAELQRAPSPRSVLSPAATITLITKIQQLSLLPPLIFPHTRDAYITPQYLTTIILTQLSSNHGRLTIPELSSMLSISPSHITTAIQPLLKSNPPQVILTKHASTLLTPAYTKALIQTIIHDLKTSPTGLLSLPDLARTHSLPIAYIRSLITSNLPGSTKPSKPTTTTIPAILSKDATLLLTPAAAHRDRTIAIALLRATTIPTLLSTLSKTHNISEDLFRDIVRNKDTNAGVIVSGVYEPHVYKKAREQILVRKWREKGFVECEEVEDLIGNGRTGGSSRKANWRENNVEIMKDYVEKKLGKCITVNEGFLGVEVMQRVKDAVRDAAVANSWLDVASLLPTGLSEEQIAEIVSRVCNLHELGEEMLQGTNGVPRGCDKCAGIEVGGRYVVSQGLLEKCMRVLEADAAKEAKKSYKGYDLAGSAIRITGKESSETVGREDAPRGSSRKRRRGRKETRGNVSMSPNSDEDSLAYNVPSLSAALSLLARDGELAASLEFDNLGSAAGNTEISSSERCLGVANDGVSGTLNNVLRVIVSSKLIPILSSVYRKAAEAHQVEAKTQAAKSLETMSEAVLQTLDEAQLYNAGVVSLPLHLKDMSRKHILESLSETTRNILLIIANTQLGLAIDPSDKPSSGDLMQMLPPDILYVTNPLVYPTTLDDYLATYDKLSTQLELAERQPFDKETTFSSIKTKLLTILEQVSHSQSTAHQFLAVRATEVLEAAARLVHMRCNDNAMVAIASAGVLRLCVELNSKAPKNDSVMALMQLKEGVMTFLRCVDGQNSEQIEENWEKILAGTSKMVKLIR